MAERIVLSGWGQVTQRKEAAPPFFDPVDLMEQAAREAGVLSGAGIWPRIDALLLVRPLSRNLREPAADLARRLGITPRIVRLSGIGGETPQHFVNQAAGLLARAEARAVLICGAETYYPRSAEAARGDGAIVQGRPADYDAEDGTGSDDYEQRHGLILPIHGFPLYETALWAKSGLPLEAWLGRVGAMWSRFSEIAARHPNAWTREPLSAARIVTPAPDNRPICFPYTKRMVSLVMADLGAAVILTTEREAKTLHGGGGKPVHFLGGAFAKDRQRHMVDKSDFTRGPAIAAAAARAQRRAKLRIEAIDGFDLYSCFPCAVTIAKNELGIADDDPRDLTQTGGMGFFGGPGSNYALHGIASLATHIASGKIRSGMATGVGWMIQKYAIGIYADAPTDGDLRGCDREDLQSAGVGDPPLPRVEVAAGAGRLETYTVIYGRDQRPERGLLYGRTDEGLRFVANSVADEQTFQRLTHENRVGARVSLSHDPVRGINVAAFVD